MPRPRPSSQGQGQRLLQLWIERVRYYRVRVFVGRSPSLVLSRSLTPRSRYKASTITATSSNRTIGITTYSSRSYELSSAGPELESRSARSDPRLRSSSGYRDQCVATNAGAVGT